MSDDRAEVHWEDEDHPTPVPISLDVEWEDDTEPDTEHTSIENIFLLASDGTVMNQYTRRRSSDIDPDILTSMLMAVRAFVGDSFQEAKGELDMLKFGRLSIVMCQGEFVTIAAVIRGPGAMDFRSQIDRAILELEAEHHELLEGWKGTNEGTHELDEQMKKLVLGEYK